MNKERVRGFISGVLITILVLGMSFTAFAATGNQTITAAYNNIKIYIDEKLITPKDANGKTVEPFIYNGTTYLPVRAVGEAFGKNVDWDSASKSVIIGKRPASLDQSTNTSFGFIFNDDYLSSIGKTAATLEAKYGKLTYFDLQQGGKIFVDAKKEHAFSFDATTTSNTLKSTDVCASIYCGTNDIITNFTEPMAFNTFVSTLKKTSGVSDIYAPGPNNDESEQKLSFAYEKYRIVFFSSVGENNNIVNSEFLVVFAN